MTHEGGLDWKAGPPVPENKHGGGESGSGGWSSPPDLEVQQLCVVFEAEDQAENMR